MEKRPKGICWLICSGFGNLIVGTIQAFEFDLHISYGPILFDDLIIKLSLFWLLWINIIIDWNRLNVSIINMYFFLILIFILILKTFENSYCFTRFINQILEFWIVSNSKNLTLSCLFIHHFASACRLAHFFSLFNALPSTSHLAKFILIFLLTL